MFLLGQQMIWPKPRCLALLVNDRSGGKTDCSKKKKLRRNEEMDTRGGRKKLIEARHKLQ